MSAAEVQRPEGAAEAESALGRAPQLRFRSLIAGAPVVGFTGPNGAGKTLVAVSEAIADMAKGRPVFSTVPIESPWGHSVPLRSLRQLLEIHGATVLIDEVSVVLSSRATSSLPDEVVTFLQSMRHQDVTLRWTAPAWMRADVLLREVTQVSVAVHPMAAYLRPGEFWPTPRLVLCGAMDTNGIKTDADPTKVLRRRIYRPGRLPGWGAYDTHHQVSRIGWNRPAGICVDCGGSIPRAVCSESRHADLGLPGGLPDRPRR